MENELPLFVAQGGEAAVVGPVEELFSLPRAPACKQLGLIVAVQVDLICRVASLIAGQQLLLDVGKIHNARHLFVDPIDNGSWRVARRKQSGPQVVRESRQPRFRRRLHVWQQW